MDSKTKLFQQLQDGGAFANDETQAHTIKLGEDEATVYVAELADAEFRKIFGNRKGYDRAEMIAEAIRDEEGNRIFTAEQAGRIKPRVARQLEELCMKANGLGDEARAKAGKP